MGWVGCVGWARDLRPTAAEPNRTAGAGGRGAQGAGGAGNNTLALMVVVRGVGRLGRGENPRNT